MKCCLLTVIAFQKLPKGMPILQSDCLWAGLLAKQWVQFHFNLLRLYLKCRGVKDRWAEWAIVHQDFDRIESDASNLRLG